MPFKTESLRGYGHDIHKINNFKCKYCGYDGRSFPNWFQLTVDHIVPSSQGGTDYYDNMTTSCQACNAITSRMKFPRGMPKKAIIQKKRKRVRERQKEFFDFWKTSVAPLYITTRKR